MTIPEIRKRLLELAEYYGDCELESLAYELTRRNFGRSEPKSQPMTPAIRARIIAMKKAQPDVSMSDIAKALNINTGRVSETLHGFRK